MRCTRRSVIRITLALAVATGLAACGGGDDAVESSTRATDAPGTTRAATPSTGATGSAPSPSGTVAPAAAGVALDVAFLRNGKLGIAHRRVAPTQAVGRAALEQLLLGPTADEKAAGLVTAVPSGTRLQRLSIADDVATVDFSPALTARDAQAQVVLTLTQFPSVKSVRFGASGAPITTADFDDRLPMILVRSVAPGDQVTSPVNVSGLSNTFESNVRIRVVGADGRILADTFTTGQGAMGTWGPFQASVPFDRGTNTTGTVVAFETSAETGAMTNVVEVPVRFA